MHIVYSANPDSFINAANAEFGDYLIDSAIASVPNLDQHAYLSALTAIVGVGVLPTYSSAVMQSEDFYLAEHDIYGSSRVGVKDYYDQQVGISYSVDPSSHIGSWSDSSRLWLQQPWYSLEYQDLVKTDSMNLYGNAFTGPLYARHILGQKQYELTDHLGDVLATVSDKRAGGTFAATTGGAPTAGDPATILTWKPVVVSTYDYYPFGEYMPGRYMVDTTAHCVTTTITEMVPTVYYTTLPPATPPVGGGGVGVGGGGVITTFGGATLMTGSVYYGGSSMRVSTGTGGGVTYTHVIDPGVVHSPNVNIQLGIGHINGSFTATATDSFGVVQGSVNLHHTHGVGTVNLLPVKNPGNGVSITLTAGDGGTDSIKTIWVTFVGVPHDTIEPQNVVTTVCNTDYYRYGHNGQLKVNEIAGVGNHYTAKFWDYDTRVGRRWNLDPWTQISASNYSVFGNSPIINADPNGDLFFGLVGSTSEQRKAARGYQKEHGGETRRKYHSDIHNHYLSPNDSHGLSAGDGYGVAASGAKDHYFTPGGGSGGSSFNPEMNEFTDDVGRHDDYNAARRSSGPVRSVDYEAMLIPLPPVLRIVGGLGKAEVELVEQYSLRAAKDGFYPVMERGFAEPTGFKWLEEGEVWKFGTTKNPLTRYTQKFLRNTGQGLKYQTEFEGTTERALSQEKTKLINYKLQTGELPPGNKILK